MKLVKALLPAISLKKSRNGRWLPFALSFPQNGRHFPCCLFCGLS